MFKEGVKYGSVLLNIGMILIVRTFDVACGFVECYFEKFFGGVSV